MPDIKGILGTKLGMTQIFEDTRAIAVTAIAGRASSPDQDT
jgi:ribosomal protein L3